MVNKVILIGNMGKDPEIRNTGSGTPVGKFSVATSENYKDKAGEWQKQTEWHDVIVWRNLAERASKSLSKGAAVYIEGKLTHRTYEDGNGNKRYITEVVASYFRVISKREEPKAAPPEPAPVVAVEKPDPSGIDDADDLPF